MKKKMMIIVFLIAFVLTLIELYVDANCIQISNFKVRSDKIPSSFDGYKILQLSDLHSKEFGKNNTKLLKKIEKISPDLILITGDMVTANETDFSVFFNLIDNIADTYDVYYVTGNHEQAMSGDRKSEIFNYLSEKNVTFLDNQSVQLTKDGESINLYGLCYDSRYYTNKKGKVYTETLMEDAIGKPSEDGFNILITHNPSKFEIYEAWGADLTLSGHVHGGMVRVPFVGAIFSPDEGLMPKYSAGEYQINESKLIVSRGLGRGSRGFRLFNRPNLVEITLEST